jgi:DNA-binding MarR family transcriptional regulator
MGIATKAAPVESPEALSGNLAWLLSRASYALATELTAGLAELGLSPRAHCVLSTAMTGELTQTELAQAVGLDKTTMVVTIDELERDGLAERQPSPTDRRARVISVTSAGKRKLTEANAVKEQVQSDVLESLPASQRKALLGALTDLVEGRLSEQADCSGLRRREPRG